MIDQIGAALDKQVVQQVLACQSLLVPIHLIRLPCRVFVFGEVGQFFQVLRVLLQQEHPTRYHSETARKPVMQIVLSPSPLSAALLLPLLHTHIHVLHLPLEHQVSALNLVQATHHPLIDVVDLSRYVVSGPRLVQQEGNVIPCCNDQRQLLGRGRFADVLGKAVGLVPQQRMLRFAPLEAAVDEQFVEGSTSDLPEDTYRLHICWEKTTPQIGGAREGDVSISKINRPLWGSHFLIRNPTGGTSLIRPL